MTRQDQKMPAFNKISPREKSFPDTKSDAEPVPGDIGDVVDAEPGDYIQEKPYFSDKVHVMCMVING